MAPMPTNNTAVGLMSEAEQSLRNEALRRDSRLGSSTTPPASLLVERAASDDSEADDNEEVELSESEIRAKLLYAARAAAIERPRHRATKTETPDSPHGSSAAVVDDVTECGSWEDEVYEESSLGAQTGSFSASKHNKNHDPTLAAREWLPQTVQKNKFAKIRLSWTSRIPFNREGQETVNLGALRLEQAGKDVFRQYPPIGPDHEVETWEVPWELRQAGDIDVVNVVEQHVVESEALREQLQNKDRQTKKMYREAEELWEGFGPELGYLRAERLVSHPDKIKLLKAAQLINKDLAETEAEVIALMTYPRAHDPTESCLVNSGNETVLGAKSTTEEGLLQPFKKSRSLSALVDPIPLQNIEHDAVGGETVAMMVREEDRKAHSKEMYDKRYKEAMNGEMLVSSLATDIKSPFEDNVAAAEGYGQVSLPEKLVPEWFDLMDASGLCAFAVTARRDTRYMEFTNLLSRAESRERKKASNTAHSGGKPAWDKAWHDFGKNSFGRRTGRQGWYSCKGRERERCRFCRTRSPVNGTLSTRNLLVISYSMPLTTVAFLQHLQSLLSSPQEDSAS